MKILPFLGFVLLATFAQNANSSQDFVLEVQEPVPSPFWKNVKPKEEKKKEEELTMEVRPAPMACSGEKVFKKFLKEKDFEFSPFHGKSGMMKDIYVLFFHNERTNEFAVVRTDGKGLYCILEVGTQNLGDTIGPVNYDK